MENSWRALAGFLGLFSDEAGSLGGAYQADHGAGGWWHPGVREPWVRECVRLANVDVDRPRAYSVHLIGKALGRGGVV